MKSIPVTLFLVVVSLLSAGSLRAAETESIKSKPKPGLLETLLTLPVETAQGATSSFEKSIFNLGEIKVSGARVSSDASDETATDLPRNITVVGAGEIAANAYESLPEMLSQQEGVTYADDLGRGLNARVDLRGFGGEAKQALVLFDGVRAVEPFDNSMAWHLYPSEYVDRVEIQRGGTTILGEGALSGAIRMRTKGPTKDTRITTEHSYGDWRSVMNFADASGTTHGVGFYVGARYFSTDGYRQNGDHESVSSLVKARYDFSDVLAIENAFYFADNETGIAGPLSATEVAQNRRQKDPDGQFGDQFADKLVQDSITATLFLERVGVELSNLFSVRHRNQDSVQTFGGLFGGTSLNDIKTYTYSNVIQATRRLESGRYASEFTAGVEWSIDDIYNPSVFLSGFGPFESERAVDRRMLGYFARNLTTIDERWILEAGVRYDDINWDIYDLLTPPLEKHKKAENLSPQFGLEYKIFEPLSVYGSYAETFKAPDSNALIFETPNLFTPNPDVDPSVARHHELGVRYAHPVFGSIRADVFLIETKKEILFNTFSTLNENYDTRRSGLELANELAVTKEIQLFANYTYTEAEFDNGAFDGNSVPLVPESRWSAGFAVRPDTHWTLSAQATGVYDQFVLNDFRNRFPLDDYWTLGAKASYRRGNWEVYVRGQNLLGEEYSSFATSNAAGTVLYNPAPTSYAEAGFKMEI